MKPFNIRAGGEYSGGTAGRRRLVRVVFQADDPKVARVKYHDLGEGGSLGTLKYCSLGSFANWAKRRVKHWETIIDGV